MGANIHALNVHQNHQDVLEASWKSFEGSSAHKAMKAHRLETLLANPDSLWESIGPDAIKYPFNDSMLGKTEAEREETRKHINSFDQHLARQLATLIITQDDAELGRIIRDMAEQYLADPIDEWVDENWREWL